MRKLKDHLFGPGPKRILALDGGGVRGVLTLGLLGEMEALLKSRVRETHREQFRLCHYFDLIGGTSTGGIIASLLALGWTVDQVRECYFKLCPRVFTRRSGVVRGLFNRYDLIAPGFDSDEFKRAVEEVLAEHLKGVGRTGMLGPSLDSDLIHTGLAIFCKRIDTGSVWALTNNPRQKYWDPDTQHWVHTFETEEDRFHPNAKFPLGVLAQGTASAPFLLDALELSISPKQSGVFIDGGASPFNCPALELFQMATLKQYDDEGKVVKFSPYGFDWEAGEDNVLLYSLGTGTWRTQISAENYMAKHNWDKAKTSLTGIIDDCIKHSIIWLQAISQPIVPYRVDGNLERMEGLRIMRDKLLTFRRVDVPLDVASLKEFDFHCDEAVVADIRRLDNPQEKNLARLDKIGRRAAQRLFGERDFPAKFDPVYDLS